MQKAERVLSVALVEEGGCRSDTTNFRDQFNSSAAERLLENTIPNGSEPSLPLDASSPSQSHSDEGRDGRRSSRR